MQKQTKEFNVDAMCDALDVNRSGYYAYKNAPLSMRQTEDERLMRAAKTMEQSEFRKIYENWARKLVGVELED